MSRLVWLTGAGSFTAQHLIPLLQQAGYSVINETPDITDAAACLQFIASHQPDYIIHLAAVSFVPDGNSAQIYAVNTLGTENVLAAATSKPPQKIILASSSHVYGRQMAEVLTEDLLPAPVSHYGCSKLAMEHIAGNYQDRLNCQIVRPFNYTGQGQAEKFLLPKLVAHFAQPADTITLGNIDVWRDISDVRWVAEVYLRLLSAPLSPIPLNICRGKAISIRQMLSALRDITGHNLRVVQDPLLMRHDEIQKQCGDPSALKQCLPDLPPPPALTATLDWMLSAHT